MDSRAVHFFFSRPWTHLSRQGFNDTDSAYYDDDVYVFTRFHILIARRVDRPR